MANVGFTRDEIILTLDVLYSAGDDKLTKNSPKIEELCSVLQTLPIHPEEKRPPNFRNTVGVSDQIRGFQEEAIGVERSRWGIGKKFHKIAEEFQGRTDELHEIANAIRRNKDYFCSCNFGQVEENSGFPEGSLLAHLHRVIERRDGKKIPKKERCEICQIDMGRIYDEGDGCLEQHLLVPIVKLDAGKKYGADEFITVCPNCHAVLHRYRPWRTQGDYKTILK